MLNKFPGLQSLSQWIGGRQGQTESPAIDIWVYAEPAGEEANPLRRNVLQWRRLITAVPDPIFSFAGQSVDVVGFVHRPLGTPPNQLVVARQIIRCCLADTVPLGLTLQGEDLATYADQSWLRVRGRFEGVQQGTRSQLVVRPDRLEVIDPPQKQYINGVF
ncbi:MAG: TIGR03943 family protein [Cyanobacteriota bacterium]|nr:TIGR03943 family protein [Cyanobacteriota bacterium]